MHLTNDDVDHVAELARLGLTDGEKVRLREQLSSILDHIVALNELDTSQIPPTARVDRRSNVLRADTVRPSLSREAVLANAPRQRDGFFEVDAILGTVDEAATEASS